MCDLIIHLFIVLTGFIRGIRKEHAAADVISGSRKTDM